MEAAALDRIVTGLEAAKPHLDEHQQRIAIALYRLLAEAQPVAPESLAERTGSDPAEIRRLLDEWPGVYRDDAGDVIGFWGMALEHMPHRMRVNDNEVRGWCAADTLFLPELLGQTASVESTCPATGETITLTVDAAGVHDVSPPGAVLSFLYRDRPFDADTINTFCHYVHFFASEDTAREWTARHAGTFILSIEDGFQIARRLNQATFGAVLDRPQATEAV